MADLNRPVIVVPGITATSLEDQYPLTPELLWAPPLYRDFDRISMHPDDPRYEAVGPSRVAARSLLSMIYEDLVAALRHDLSPSPDKPTPVYAFSYDWRQDCRRSADQLGAFIDEVLARAALLPHYATDPPDRVDLVGHSMGGLLIAHLLRAKGLAARVRRVVTLGTPFQGAIDAVAKLTTGMGRLTGDHPRDREREAARTIPAIYQLLPSYEGAIPQATGTGDALFERAIWQPSVLQTLKAYCRRLKVKKPAEEVFEGLLGFASELRKSTDGLRLSDALPEKEDGWLAIVGVGAPTQVSFDIQAGWFQFTDPENDLVSGRTGDGTVPFLGACPRFLKREQLVCVTPEDFSFWEIQDRALAAVGSFHAFLPALNLAQRLAIRFLWPKFSGDVWGRRAPGAAETHWPKWIKEK